MTSAKPMELLVELSLLTINECYYQCTRLCYKYKLVLGYEV